MKRDMIMMTMMSVTTIMTEFHLFTRLADSLRPKTRDIIES
jgi:hypothetical protein